MGAEACRAIDAADDLELGGQFGRGDDLGDLGGAQVAVELSVPDASAANVAHSLREGAIRLSPHFFNTRDEILRTLEILAE